MSGGKTSNSFDDGSASKLTCMPKAIHTALTVSFNSKGVKNPRLPPAMEMKSECLEAKMTDAPVGDGVESRPCLWIASRSGIMNSSKGQGSPIILCVVARSLGNLYMIPTHQRLFPV
jgi:hypothetical protein